jgi:hypothetical protein
MKILKKVTLKATLLLCGVALLSGCSMKNATTSKSYESSYVNSAKTLINQNNNALTIENELDVTQSYKTQQCGYETRYLGIGTNTLMYMFGFDSYMLNERAENIRDFEVSKIIGTWIGAGIMLPIMVGVEIITFQPFHAYKNIRVCDDYESHKQAKTLSNEGTFRGTILVENSNGEHDMKFDFDDEEIPLEISLQDTNDIFASSKKSIDTSNGLTVKINGFYKVNGRFISVDESKKIQ